MKKWMVIAILCSMNSNAMEHTEEVDHAQHLIGDALVPMCEMAWLSEYSRRKWKSTEQVKQETIVNIAEGLGLVPKESKCLNILETMRKFASLPTEQRKCQNPNYATALMTTEAFAQTIDDEILKSVFDDEQTYQYFKNICQPQRSVFKIKL